jgi:predicted nuclease with RNAse H fold
MHLTIPGATDLDIRRCIAQLASESDVVVGIDAPLSYNAGGGHRPSDSDLSRRMASAGSRSASVMAPTLTRMAYLTLRGVSLTRLLLAGDPPFPRIVEVHPGAAMALRGAPVDAVRSFKREEGARWELLEWLERQGIGAISAVDSPSDHYVAACAAALSAWKWQTRETVWLYPADLPLHPFDFAC